MKVRRTLARSWAACCHVAGQVPWLALSVFALVAVAAWLRYRLDWVTMVGFVVTTANFYFAGRNIQNRSNKKVLAETHASCMQAHQVAQDAVERFAEISKAYRRLHGRHHAMTGEVYQDSAVAPDHSKVASKTHNA